MIVNQPHDVQLGIRLIEALQNNDYTQLTIMVAYAKLSGVYRLFPYIEQFHKKGNRVRIIVGIDQQNTTYDALKQLSKISDNLFVFHSESISQTFHVKCYWLSGTSDCWYAIGSNNLTAGGLFSNYELSTINQLEGDQAKLVNDELEKIYSVYANQGSACCHEINPTFLTELLEQNYVVREIQQRKALAEYAQRAKKAITKERLFGNEIFPAPALPDEYRKTRAKKTPKKEEPKKPIQEALPIVTARDDRYTNNYLIRLVPKAGDRSKQVHFTVDLLERFFCLTPGDGILVQEMLSTGEVGEIEQRQVVFSKRNKNVKIELAGASMLDTNYPSDPENRPVLILKRVNDNLFVYMIILKGNDGYDAINEHLKSLPTGRALPYEVIDELTMFSLWSECPIT